MASWAMREANFHGASRTPGGYAVQFLYNGDSCKVIATNAPAGVSGPPTHVHPTSDQIYFVVDGSTTIKLGSEIFRAPTGSSIYIPAGVPHHSWNEGDVPAVNLEVIAPAPSPLVSLAEMTDSEDALGLPYQVREPVSVRDDCECQDGVWLWGDAQASEAVGVRLHQLAPGQGGRELRVHHLDQFYFVLAGVLNVQMALEVVEVTPMTLVVIHAGVPHRRWNAGADSVRHLTISAPCATGPGIPVSLSRDHPSV
jgi:mannose-6-phosphate isomerase-like protein (cupin superfamily)